MTAPPMARRLTPDSAAELESLLGAAAARRDFREAAHLQTMLEVLGPKPPLAPDGEQQRGGSGGSPEPPGPLS